MPDHSENVHIYGAPDPDNRQPTPEQGLRGEQSTPEPTRSDLARTVSTATGKTIYVEEQSGTAFAEVTERADGTEPGGVDDTSPSQDEDTQEAAIMEQVQKEAAGERKESGYQ